MRKKMFEVYVLLLIFILCVINYKWKRRRLVKMMEQFDGPPVLPIIGNGLDFLGDTSDVLKQIINLWNTYESPSRVWLLNKAYVMIYSPEDFQTVAFKTLQKDDSYKFIAEMLGDGIFTSNVEKWRNHRRLLNAAFNPLFMREFLMDIFNQKSKELVQLLEKRSGTGENFDLWPYFIQTSLGTISETAMGYEEKFPEQTFSAFGTAVIKSAYIVSKRFYQPWLRLSIIFMLYKYVKGYEKYFKTVRDYPLKMLAAKKQQMYSDYNLTNSDNKRKCNLKDATKKKNFVGILLESYEHRYFTDQELKDEVTSIMFGGSETSAVTSCFVLLMLGMQQDVQERVYQEIYEVFGDGNGDVEMEDISRLHFLEQCIKETLRRFPIVPIIMRHAKEDISINNKFVIPAGADILLSILAVHHNPEIYPQPFRWNPHNFSAENEATRHKCSFIPFSTGPRGCIGQKYALVLLKTQLCIVLRKFRVYTDMKMEDIELSMDLIIRSKHGYKVILQCR